MKNSRSKTRSKKVRRVWYLWTVAIYQLWLSINHRKLQVYPLNFDWMRLFVYALTWTLKLISCLLSLLCMLCMQKWVVSYWILSDATWWSLLGIVSNSLLICWYTSFSTCTMADAARTISNLRKRRGVAKSSVTRLITRTERIEAEAAPDTGRNANCAGWTTGHLGRFGCPSDWFQW